MPHSCIPDRLGLLIRLLEAMYAKGIPFKEALEICKHAFADSK